MDDIYYQKYLKYKNKYLELQKNSGGAKGKSSKPIKLFTSKKKTPTTNPIDTIKMEMDDYEKIDGNKNKIKNAITTYSQLKTLTTEEKKNIPSYSIIGSNDKYQMFRYIIYFLVKFDLEINKDNFNKITNLKYDDINKLLKLTKSDIDKILEINAKHKIEINRLTGLTSENITKLLELNTTMISNLFTKKIKGPYDSKADFINNNDIKKILGQPIDKITDLLQFKSEKLYEQLELLN